MKYFLLILVIFTFYTQTFAQNNCTANSHYVECLNNCPITCANRKQYPTPRECIQVCLSAGCECDPGFYSNGFGDCITESQCPKTCCENEVLNTCGNGCGIKNEQTCEDWRRRRKPTRPTTPPGIACPAVCVELCECAKGFYRHKYGKCVTPRQCRSY